MCTLLCFIIFELTLATMKTTVSAELILPESESIEISFNIGDTVDSVLQKISDGFLVRKNELRLVFIGKQLDGHMRFPDNANGEKCYVVYSMGEPRQFPYLVDHRLIATVPQRLSAPEGFIHCAPYHDAYDGVHFFTPLEFLTESNVSISGPGIKLTRMVPWSFEGGKYHLVLPHLLFQQEGQYVITLTHSQHGSCTWTFPNNDKVHSRKNCIFPILYFAKKFTRTFDIDWRMSTVLMSHAKDDIQSKAALTFLTEKFFKKRLLDEMIPHIKKYLLQDCESVSTTITLSD